MNLDELLARLSALRRKHGGDFEIEDMYVNEEDAARYNEPVYLKLSGLLNGKPEDLEIRLDEPAPIGTRSVAIYRCQICVNKNVHQDLREESGGHGQWVDHLTIGKEGKQPTTRRTINPRHCPGPMVKEIFEIGGTVGARTLMLLKESPVVDTVVADDGTLILMQENGDGWVVEDATFRIIEPEKANVD